MRIAFELASDADSKLAARVWNLLFHMHSMGSKIIPGMPVCYKAEGCEIKPWSCHSKITKRNLENAGQAEKSNGAKWSALMEDFLEKCTLIRIMRIMIEKLFPLCRTRHRRDIGFNTAEEIERAGLFISTCDREGALSWGNKHKCACVRVGGHRVREALKKNPKKHSNGFVLIPPQSKKWLVFIRMRGLVGHGCTGTISEVSPSCFRVLYAYCFPFIACNFTVLGDRQSCLKKCLLEQQAAHDLLSSERLASRRRCRWSVHIQPFHLESCIKRKPWLRY